MVELTRTPCKVLAGSVARCRKSFGSRKDRAEESASQPGNHIFGRGFSLDASLYGDMFVQVLQPVHVGHSTPEKLQKLLSRKRKKGNKMTEFMKEQIELARASVVQVGDGRGFLVEVANKYFDYPRRRIVTAAHFCPKCLPATPACT
jgi:hypothetical protein